MEKQLDLLAIELFQTFSRFEYSLKVAGFHQGEGAAKPDWRNFSKSISEIFEHPVNKEFNNAIQYILMNPPKKQIIKSGLLEWKNVAPDTEMKSDLVLLYVRRVRNNLFHGGKFNGHWFEPERSKELLESSLIILKQCLDVSSTLKEAYES